MKISWVGAGGLWTLFFILDLEGHPHMLMHVAWCVAWCSVDNVVVYFASRVEYTWCGWGLGVSHLSVLR